MSVDNLAFSSDWHIAPFLPDGPLASGMESKQFSVFMPLEINGKVTNYSFVFKIVGVSFQ
jgi:hypothetical protein